MGRPLEGIKVVEAAMWAFVPVAGAMLADLGAEVIKVEPVNGDPIRGLRSTPGATGAEALELSWECYNRGKKSITLDLKSAEGQAVLIRLLADADVFLTNFLPRARKAMNIDAETLRARFPRLIYAVGSAVGQRGPEGDKGGYDAISYWARGGISSALTEPDADFPVAPAGPAHGDTLSGSMLAGGVCAAIAKRAMTGEASTVDVSLLNAAMWSMQRGIAQTMMDGTDNFPRPPRGRPNNVLSYTYRTSDGRFLALCMLQADKYWARLMHLVGRPDMADDPRYVDAAARRENVEACLAELTAIFAARPLAEWREILAKQDGQWDLVQHIGELHRDVQVQANDYIQMVRTTAGVDIPVVSVPVQFDGAAMPAGQSPDVGAHSDELLAAAGFSEDEIIDLKVKGVVF
ncbi:CaiB/BaiF CoA-transferase family protein [Novosphingobium sp. TH158]|uniref:CaiB/BaiF CoA transferase family protein n=1 Tax=Novosphingobium sp. TH158 TaxID=2067455 RepID=UPI000C7B3E5F|nr:CoA transferase [Novosphingobium sp. TH158]PLK26961.1 carnitine dehydratase [Novosphingobium sp. TH158]